jgi:predicted DNA-binding transcriptional regulator YafY
VSEETFEVKVFTNHSISHYFTRRDLLPEQEVVAESDDGVTIRCQAAHENQILPLIFYWLPNIQVLEPQWLRDKLFDTLEGYMTNATADALE